jgi:hypothetical protein
MSLYEECPVIVVTRHIAVRRDRTAHACDAIKRQMFAKFDEKNMPPLHL